MKKIVCILLLVVAHNIITAQEKLVMTKNFDVNAVNTVEAETSGGNIIVYGASSETKAELYAESNNSRNKKLSEAEINEKLNKEYDIQFEVQQNKLIAIAKSKKRNNWRNGLSISFKIYVGKNTSTDLSTSGGNIELYNVKGRQEFVTSGGNLVVKEVSGKISGTTSGGNIIAENLQDEIGLSTSGGNIEAKLCTGTIKLTTSGGNIELKELKGNIDASTSGGNVEGETIEGQLSASTSGGNIFLSKLSCGLTAGTSGGDIDVSLSNVAKPIRITNSGGNIKLAMPKGSGVNLNLYADRISTDTLENFSGKMDKDQPQEMLQGKLNGGGADVTVKANAGNIVLELK